MSSFSNFPITNTRGPRMNSGPYSPMISSGTAPMPRMSGGPVSSPMPMPMSRGGPIGAPAPAPTPMPMSAGVRGNIVQGAKDQALYGGGPITAPVSGKGHFRLVAADGTVHEGDVNYDPPMPGPSSSFNGPSFAPPPSPSMSSGPMTGGADALANRKRIALAGATANTNLLAGPYTGTNTYSQDQQLASQTPSIRQQTTDASTGLENAQAGAIADQGEAAKIGAGASRQNVLDLQRQVNQHSTRADKAEKLNEQLQQQINQLNEKIAGFQNPKPGPATKPAATPAQRPLTKAEVDASGSIGYQGVMAARKGIAPGSPATQPSGGPAGAVRSGTLPDGRRVHQLQDGSVVDEEGKPVQ